MKNIKIVLFFLLSVSVILADQKELEPKSAVTGNTAFALDLYSQLRGQNGNIFFSPYSISSALAMTYAGARGLTAAELAKALHFNPDDRNATNAAFAVLDSLFDSIAKKGNIQLKVANSMWPQKDYAIRTDFLELTKRYYNISITPVDYANAAGKARTLINSWVEKQTNNKIRNLIAATPDPATAMILVNAIYFKGNWESQFDPELTVEADFFRLGKAKTTIPMMYQEGNFGYAKIDGAKLLELPYVGNELSMVIILPDSPGGLPDLEDRLSTGNLETWLSGISQKTVEIYLPRFKVTWGTLNMTKQMISLGVHRAFGNRADFSGIDGTKSLFIKGIFHKAFIEVNEEGAEAAAATGVLFETSIPKMKSFKADHPFFFLIRDIQSGSILFLGRILDPNQDTE
ncbi:MAG: serpin family protein [FCB group bacterium]|nr:serpin family protein [FCB group bacterium]